MLGVDQTLELLHGQELVSEAAVDAHRVAVPPSGPGNLALTGAIETFIPRRPGSQRPITRQQFIFVIQSQDEGSFAVRVVGRLVEVGELAPHLLLPTARCMRRKREVGMGFLGFSSGFLEDRLAHDLTAPDSSVR
jgi:hypothetical protein